MNKTFLLAVFLIVTGNVFAQFNKITQITNQPLQYERSDFEIELKTQWKKYPYLQEEVALDMVITTPSGIKLTLPCYYESGESGKASIWKARFAPQETGQYKYSFQLTGGGKSVKKSQEQTFESKASGKSGFLHTRDYWTLRFDNGKPFRGIAENICWESRDRDDSKFYKDLHERADIYNYEYLLPDFAKNGGNFFRTWMSGWNLPIDQKGRINNSRYTPSDEYYNPSALAKMDRLMDLSDSLQLYIMLTLGQGDASLREEGITTTPEDFFIHPKVKAKYKNRLRYIVARWGYSTGIAMWEFFNEVDNVQFRNKDNPIKAEYITQWHDEMATYLKKIDPYHHIVTTSISHRDVDGMNLVKDLDINQKHIYNNTSVIPEEIKKYTEAFEKPYIIGEFGYEWDWQKNFSEFADGMDIDFKRGLWYGLFSPTPVTPMSWWWEFFDNRWMTTYFRGVRAISDKMLAAGNGSFEPVAVKAEKAHAFGLKCGDELFVYIYNPEKAIFMSDITIESNGNKKYAVQCYEPTLMLYKDVKDVSFSSSGIVLKRFPLSSQKEMVFLLKPVK
ncbi:hypothetical protein FACS18947_4170 [Bacteroidia bacterium]|nr:hypothetical protein FACS18947_4170 [Bacteroidia bacterium]